MQTTPQRQLKLYVPIIDNGGGMSVTRWGYSLARACLSGAFDGHYVSLSHVSYPYPAGAMNIVTHEFLKSDCERMIVIDTDESFTPEHVKMLLSHDVPFVAGLYPKKVPGLEFPCVILDDGGEVGTSPFADDPSAPGVEPLVEVAQVARGFLNVHRSVFDLLIDDSPEYLDGVDNEVKREFWRGLPGGGSEDYQFCDRYRAKGGKVLVDQRIVANHWGLQEFPIKGTYPTINRVERN